MKKLLCVALALMLCACGEHNPLDPSDTDTACRDGVEYLTFYKLSTNGSASMSIVPHFKPDGTLYTCTNKPRS